MREGRPYGKLFLHGLQFAVLLLLVQAVNNQIWYTAVADVEYTEGLPERAGMEIELEVDQDSADAHIEFTGFFSWVQWQNDRNDTTIPSDYEDKEESDEILNKIFEHQAKLELTCRFTWTENTVCIWDNRSVIHFAIADFYKGRGLGYERVMDRIAIEGDQPC